MNIKILSGLALIVATSVVASPAFAGGVPQTMRLTNTSGQAAAALNAGRRPTATQAEARTQARRERTYRAYYHRKFGTTPSDQQVQAWYAHAYRQQPS